MPPTARAVSQARQYPKASLGARFLAALCDSLVCVIAIVPAAILLALSGGYNGGAINQDIRSFSVYALVGSLALFAAFLWTLWYSFVKDGQRGGAGYGKRALGLMVVNIAENRAATRGESAMRALIWFVLGLVPIIGWLVEPIVAIASDDGRRLGDRAAGTQVIRAADFTP